MASVNSVAPKKTRIQFNETVEVKAFCDGTEKTIQIALEARIHEIKDNDLVFQHLDLTRPNKTKKLVFLQYPGMPTLISKIRKIHIVVPENAKFKKIKTDFDLYMEPLGRHEWADDIRECAEIKEFQKTGKFLHKDGRIPNLVYLFTNFKHLNNLLITVYNKSSESLKASIKRRLDAYRLELKKWEIFDPDHISVIPEEVHTHFYQTEETRFIKCIPQEFWTLPNLYYRKLSFIEVLNSRQWDKKEEITVVQQYKNALFVRGIKDDTEAKALIELGETYEACSFILHRNLLDIDLEELFLLRLEIEVEWSEDPEELEPAINLIDYLIERHEHIGELENLEFPTKYQSLTDFDAFFIEAD